MYVKKDRPLKFLDLLQLLGVHRVPSLIARSRINEADAVVSIEGKMPGLDCRKSLMKGSGLGLEVRVQSLGSSVQSAAF